MSDVGCSHCGAPRVAGLVACTFCDVPYAGAPSGIECPKCADDNEVTRTTCAGCGASLVRSCLFCQGASSVAAIACTRCGEAFEGAEARKRVRDEEARQRQMMGYAATGLTALGAAAASPLGRSLLGQLVDGIKDEIKKG